MTSLRGLLAGLAAACVTAIAVAADPTPTPSPTPAPIPNVADLGNFVGTYVGNARVTFISDRTSIYRGPSKIQITAPSATSLKIRIDAAVTSPAGRVDIDNSLNANDSGVLTGRHLAPGAVRGVPFRSLYRANPPRITFSGEFALGKSEGTVSGFIFRDDERRLFVKYSIFTKGQRDPVYTYSYRAVVPRKS